MLTNTSAEQGLTERYPPILDAGCCVDPLQSEVLVVTGSTLELELGRSLLLMNTAKANGESIFWVADCTENGTLGYVYNHESLTAFEPSECNQSTTSTTPNGTLVALMRLTVE